MPPLVGFVDFVGKKLFDGGPRLTFYNKTVLVHLWKLALKDAEIVHMRTNPDEVEVVFREPCFKLARELQSRFITLFILTLQATDLLLKALDLVPKKAGGPV
ncbi:MAG TPA: hypothetical protein VFA15_01860 [Nitrososphaera sp.]|nr:hypothetical protein [Nitrososphaera sp.]